MAEQLESTTVSKDELDRANQELRANEKLLKALAARLITAEEEERSRVARELHDDITQRVAALAIQAGQWKRGADVTILRQSLERLQTQLGALSNEIHGLSRRLHSSTLGDLGLAEAIENECRSFFDRGGPPVDVDLKGDFSTLSPNVALTFYRIVQEGLRNIEKHSAATEVKITMRRSGGMVELEIHDNGIGFDSTAPKVGLGLSNMKERARLAEGTLEVASASGNGTTITVSVPWREDHGEASTSAR
jgi:signal transduction histidine kinase